MFVVGQLVSTASAEVTRAPQNLWMDEAEKQAEAEEKQSGDS